MSRDEIVSAPGPLLDDSPLVCSAQSWCDHDQTRIAMEPPGSVHFAREICSNCDRVLRWLPKPATIEHRRFNALRIARLSMNQALSDWERRFVKSIAQQRKLSPRQQAVLDKLAATYLRGR
jgi:hypothetical protein